MNSPDSRERIFVSVASYRDPQLVPTIDDCLRKATHPERLRFGICWQHSADDTLPSTWFTDARFQVLDVEWHESRGAGWARAKVMELYTGEEWFLQLDSHHRFVRGWDVKLIEEIGRTGHDRAVITTYAPNFTPPGDDPIQQRRTRTVFDGFMADGLPRLKAAWTPETTDPARPRRQRFISAHLLFAPGRFARDVPYDPEVYFQGEEITLSVRAFTHGYDFFEPSQLILWHQYTRSDQRKHWHDHGARNGTSAADLIRRGRERALRLLTDENQGRFGLGSVRTLADYEAFAGINFRNRRVTDHLRENLEPPDPDPAVLTASAADDQPRPTRRGRITWEISGEDRIGRYADASDSYTLNPTGAFLVDMADGTRTIQEIAELLRRQHGLSVSPIADVVAFYEEAAAGGLISMWSPSAT